MKKKPNFVFNLVGLESMTVIELGHMYLGSDANSSVLTENYLFPLNADLRISV